jgi:hypothetical protein
LHAIACSSLGDSPAASKENIASEAYLRRRPVGEHALSTQLEPSVLFDAKQNIDKEKEPVNFLVFEPHFTLAVL